MSLSKTSLLYSLVVNIYRFILSGGRKRNQECESGDLPEAASEVRYPKAQQEICEVVGHSAGRKEQKCQRASEIETG